MNEPLTRDQLLAAWDDAKKALALAKTTEMDLRKRAVAAAFPEVKEGVNTLELENDWSLKAKIKYNYKIVKPATEVWAALERIKKLGNYGAIIADKLVSWQASFLVTEYRPLVEDKDSSEEAKAILREISGFLEITEAAPELELKGPKNG